MDHKYRPWRTLVRVHDVEENAGYFHVIVPAWDTRKKLRLRLQDIPEEIRRRVKEGERFHAKVNQVDGKIALRLSSGWSEYV